MDLTSRTSVLLMAREGSTRFRNKNVAEFETGKEKKTLLEWKIEQLLEVFPPKKIILSSDASDYLDLGSHYKVTLHRRERNLAESGSFAENLKVVAKLAQTEYVLYANGPCYPLIGPKRIRAFFDSIPPTDLDDGVFAVEEMKGYILFRDAWLNFEPGENHLGSEVLENPYKVVWALTCRSTNYVVTQGSMFSRCKPTVVVPSWAAIDIDYEEDLTMAQSFIQKYFQYEEN